jgi:hypothetical protein
VLAAAAQVQGVVTSDRGERVIGATVVLVPAPALRDRGALFRTATTDHSGRYMAGAVPPGEYTLFAWEDPEEGAWHDPEFLKTYETRGERVTLTVNERKSVQLRTLPMLP